MNKEKFHQSIDNIHVPVEKLKMREQMAMLQAKRKQKARKTTTRSLLVACGLCVSLLVSGFVSTNMANALSNIPLIGSFYKDFGDISADKIEQHQLMTVINEQASKNGLTMTVKEAAYDGNRLMVSVVYTADKEIDISGVNGFGDITINGQQVVQVGGQTGQDDVDANTVIEHHQVTFANYEAYGDEIEVTVHGEDLFGYEEELEVTFPLKKVAGDSTVVTPNVSATTADELYTVTAEKVTFSPLATRIDVSVDYPVEMNENDTWPWFEYYVVDDAGKIYDGLELQPGMMPGNFGHHMVLTLPPLDKIPASFTLVPQRTNSDGYLEEIKDLTLTVPLVE